MAKRQPNDSAATEEVDLKTDDDGIAVIEPGRVVDVTEIPEAGNFSYIALRSGRVLQGSGIKTGHHYQAISRGAQQSVAEAARVRLQGLGYERVQGVACLALPGAEIWRCTEERYQEIMRRRAQRAQGVPSDKGIAAARATDAQTTVTASLKQDHF